VGRDLFEQLQPFPADAVFGRGEPGGVAGRLRQARDEPCADRIDDKATRNDKEIFSLDKTIEPQLVEEGLDLWHLPCGGEQEAETVRAA
jgi:hypothetical protein